jgi:hypothetical protein
MAPQDPIEAAILALKRALRSVDQSVDELLAIQERLKQMIRELEGFETAPPSVAVMRLYQLQQGDSDMGITVDSVGEQLLLAFEDDHGDADDAPDGIVVTFAIADPTIVTVENGASPIVDPGDPNATPPVASTNTQVIPGPLSILTAGTTQANVSFTNADGSPLLGPDGVTPVAPPAAVTIEVDPGAPAGARLSVVGS